MPRDPLRVALDTTYAGVNRTGVGLYSRRLAAYLRETAPAQNIMLRCYGSACGTEGAEARLSDIVQEWPLYTHGALPLRLAAFRPQIVHATSHIGPLWGTGRLVVTVHDLIFMRYPADYNPFWLGITRALLPHVLRRAQAILCDSATTKNDLHNFFNVPAGKAQVVYPGVDPLPNLPASPGVEAEQGRYIILLGPWVRRKNLPVAVEAFALLAGKLPDIGLVITGTGSAGMKGATPGALVAALPPPVRARVHMPGFVEREKLYSLIRGASLLAYPSRYEGFGLPPLEAMSAGVPVVASNTPVLREVAGEAALFAPANSPQAWAAAFRHILEEPGLAAHLSQAGRARSSLFSWPRCARETIQVYREVAGR